MSQKVAVFLSLTALLGWGGCNASDDKLTEPLRTVLEQAVPGQLTPVIIRAAVEPAPVRGPFTRAAMPRNRAMAELRRSSAFRLQPVINELARLGVKDYKELWIIGAVAVNLPASAVADLARLDRVESIAYDETLTVARPIPASVVTPQWNLSAVKADQLWNMGYKGQGVVVGIMDTGVDAAHAALSANWRGGVNSWRDPHGRHPAPYDANGHGTQVAGIILGGSNGSTAVGTAPQASWIAYKLFNDAGQTTVSIVHQGFQWLADPDGDPLTDDAPDIINGSWGLRTNINQCITEYQADIEALKNAGIAVVFAAGNEGPGGFTSVSPANYPGALSVGAVDQLLRTASTSSRGPSACGGGLYPLLTAPGVSVQTTDLTNNGATPQAYTFVSGTSFSAPHVAGALALLKGAFPGATSEQLELSLRQSAFDLGIAGADDTYGYGLIDIQAAYQALAAGVKCSDADRDGYYVEYGCLPKADCNDAIASAHPGAPETPLDRIDQDCNGYDQTIRVIQAVLDVEDSRLDVRAASMLGHAAELAVQGIGRMKYLDHESVWWLSVPVSPPYPDVVTVVGPEGAITEHLVYRQR